MFAIIKGHLNIVEYLINRGSKLDSYGDDVLSWAITVNKINVVEYLIKNGYEKYIKNNNHLRMAIINGNLDMLKLLINYGAEIHSGNEVDLISLADDYNQQHIKEYIIKKNWIK
mgnify:CR=1 FL=1